MSEPLYALLIAALIAVAGRVLLWPRRGFFWRWQQLRRLSERVLIEDVLKHVYKCDYRKQPPTMESLAGALGVAGNRIAELLVHTVELGLLKSTAEGLQLTPEGRNYALHIIRVHRLWEHYLAKETGVGEAAWHSEAEDREHDLSSAEVDRLDEQMGHPTYDPHGDPIPTASGDIAPRRGRSLTALPVGERATVVHIEDEPEEVYARLVDAGVHLGMQVEVVGVSSESISFLGNGEERVLDPVVAANVAVAPLSQEQEMEGPYETLAALEPRQQGRVTRISQACRGLERRRLMDLGIVPGTVIKMEMKSPGGDPTAYRIRGATIALRKEQANQVHITR